VSKTMTGFWTMNMLRSTKTVINKNIDPDISLV